MTISLYDVTVPHFLQILHATAALADKAAAHCTDNGLDEAALIDARLAPDMLPLGYQLKSVVGHSVGAVEGVREGVFSPDRSGWPTDFATLKVKMASAIAELDAVEREEIDALEGRDMRFEMGEMRMDFRAEDFLMSFSLPNFYFHAATAYDILRAQGLPLGKRDYLGRPRLKA